MTRRSLTLSLILAFSLGSFEAEAKKVIRR